MSTKVKVKKIKLPLGDKDKNLSEMFNQMIGSGAVNIAIAYPRYKRIKALCENIIKIFELVAKSPIMSDVVELRQTRDEILTYCDSARASILSVFSVDLSQYEGDLANIKEDDVKEKFSTTYEAMRRSELLNSFMKLCDRLIENKTHYKDQAKMNYRFIHNMPGCSWKPFPFSLDLKDLFTKSYVGETTIKFFMTVLHKVYELTRVLFDELHAPDIDVDQFVELMSTTIDDVQKKTELSSCGDAFQKIKESVSLLKTNFNEYYRDFVDTNDSTIIMQHFITDVSKRSDVPPTTIAQFRRIINYYRKAAQNQITDPRIKALTEKVNESFKLLERGTDNLVDIYKTDSDSE